MGSLNSLHSWPIRSFTPFAAIAYAYFLYIRPAYGKTGATVLAVLVFFLLAVLMVCRRVV